MVAAQRKLFAETRGIEARTVYAGVGEGGDRSLVTDRAAEEIAFAESRDFTCAGVDFTAISKERGDVLFGDADSGGRVFIDLIDGSLNARRMCPRSRSAS